MQESFKNLTCSQSAELLRRCFMCSVNRPLTIRKAFLTNPLLRLAFRVFHCPCCLGIPTSLFLLPSGSPHAQPLSSQRHHQTCRVETKKTGPSVESNCSQDLRRAVPSFCHQAQGLDLSCWRLQIEEIGLPTGCKTTSLRPVNHTFILICK